MASVLTTTQIVSEYGQYYIKEGQNRNRLFRSLIQMPKTLENHARHIRTTETQYRMANYRFGSVLQPFSTTFNPSSEMEFVPNKIDLNKIKVNVRVTPDDIEDMWLGFMSGNTTRNKKDWPIVRFLMEEYIANQIGKDRELNAVYKGVYNAAGTTPTDCMDGIKKKIVDGTAAGNPYPMNVITGIGQLDKDSIFDQVESFDREIDQIYWNEEVNIFVSPEWYRAFLADRRAQTFYQLRNENDIDTAIDFTGRRHKLVPLPSMAGTNDIWACTPGNLLWLTIRDMNTSSADIQAIHYDVDIMLDWWEGIGFACNKEVWVAGEMLGAAAADTASPEDGIIVRSIYPTVNAATNVASTSAKVSGKIQGDLPEGATVKMNYGTSTSLGTQSSALTATNGKYEASLTSLSASTKYYYRLEVTIGTDKYVSETKDFTTTAQ